MRAISARALYGLNDRSRRWVDCAHLRGCRGGRQKRMGGWWFFLTDKASRTSLRKIRRDYVNAMAVDGEDDQPEDDEGEG
jgi:hypothetical protein